MKHFINLILITLISSSIIAQNKVNGGIEGIGDLHIYAISDNNIRVVAAKNDGNILDTTIVNPDNNLKFRYISTDNKISFEFKLHNRIKHSWRQERPAKTLVVSDLHGRLDAFIALLKGNSVVDEELNWIFGDNQLIFLGDILDRGPDDNGIAWLLYKLEADAERMGGKLEYIIGNHEDLILKDDIRYPHEDHLIFTAKAEIPYYQLYSKHTVLGKWIRDSYLVMVIGENLFTHAGIGPKMVEKSYKIGEINELGWRFIGIPNKKRNEMHPRNELLFGNDGVLWYRGLVFNTEKYPAIDPAELDKILKYYNIKRIIVGHSEVNEVDWRFNGKVIAINVKHYKNYEQDKTCGLLIEKDELYSVTYSGKKILLNEVIE